MQLLGQPFFSVRRLLTSHTYMHTHTHAHTCLILSVCAGKSAPSSRLGNALVSSVSPIPAESSTTRKIKAQDKNTPVFSQHMYFGRLKTIQAGSNKGGEDALEVEARLSFLGDGGVRIASTAAHLRFATTTMAPTFAFSPTATENAHHMRKLG